MRSSKRDFARSALIVVGGFSILACGSGNQVFGTAEASGDAAGAGPSASGGALQGGTGGGGGATNSGKTSGTGGKANSGSSGVGGAAGKPATGGSGSAGVPSGAAGTASGAAGTSSSGGKGGASSAGGTAGPAGSVGRTVGTSGPYVWKNVAIVGGGYIPAVVFSPVEKDLIYMRTDMGGAYRWNAADRSWIALTDWVGPDDWNYLGIESIAADPRDADTVYIAAGTYTNSWTSLNGQILRSRDRGDSFERFNLPFKVGGNMPGRSMGERLAIDPNLTSTLYLGARSGNGLWKSTDSGASWKRVEAFPSAGDFAQDPADTNGYTSDRIGVTWITFDPSSSSSGAASKTLYVGVANTSAPSVYRSTDSGATWAALPGQPEAGFMAHHGVLAKNGILYLTYSDKAGPYDGGRGDVWKYDTKQESWTQISPVPSSDTSNDYFGYGGLAVDASNPDALVVTSLNSWWPDARFYRSTDAGASWKPIWDFAGYPNRANRYALDISVAPWLDWGVVKTAPEESPKLGWMTGGIHIDPFDSNRMMYGTGATLYGTTDLTNWDDPAKTIHISVFASGCEETAVQDLIAPPTGPQLVSGLGNLGGFAHTDITKVPAALMTQPTFVTTTSLDFAENDPKQVIRVGTLDSADTTNKPVGTSNDGGKTWSNAGVPAEGAAKGTVAMGANAEFIVWSTEANGAWYSHYSPYNWTKSEGIADGAVVRSDRVNPSKFYGFKAGAFYVSTDGGANFAASPAKGLPASGTFQTVFGQEGHVWLAGGTDGLWVSIDSGSSFSKVEAVEAASVVGFGKAASGQTYPTVYLNGKVDGVNGLYRSTDQGATVARINDDMHQYGAANTVIVGDRNRFGRVYLGTNGRGIVYGDPRE